MYVYLNKICQEVILVKRGEEAYIIFFAQSFCTPRSNLYNKIATIFLEVCFILTLTFTYFNFRIPINKWKDKLLTFVKQLRRKCENEKSKVRKKDR